MSHPISALHVDDDPSITDLTATFLERENDRFTVETAASADEGLHKIGDSSLDCIISDYNMPGMDGIEFLQAVREEHPELPFILFTGKGSESVASDAIAADATDYLQKQTGSEQYELLANRLQKAVQARREAERANRQEELMRLTEFAGDTGGFEMDRESDTVLLTAGTRRIIGRPNQDEITLTEALDLFHADDREEIQQTLAEAFETGEDLHGTWRLQPDGGDQRLLDVTIAPVVENGEVTKLRGVGHDITDDRERQEELHRKTDYLDVIMEDSVHPLFMKDTTGEYLLVNREYKQLFDIQDENVVGRTDRDLHPEEMAEKVWANDRRVLETEEQLKREERIIVEGEERIYLSSKYPVYFDDNSDEPDAVFGMATDITERKRREQELARKSRAMDQAPVGITLTDPQQADNPLIYANETFLTLTGYSREETMGWNHRALQGPNTEDDPVAELRRTIDAGESTTVELRNYRKDGTMFWNRVSVAPLRDETGAITNWVGFQEDVTERKHREEKLKRQNERLKEFTRVVSHDLRDPLRIADGRLELIREECESDHIDDVAGHSAGWTH